MDPFSVSSQGSGSLADRRSCSTGVFGIPSACDPRLTGDRTRSPYKILQIPERRFLLALREAWQSQSDASCKGQQGEWSPPLPPKSQQLFWGVVKDLNLGYRCAIFVLGNVTSCLHGALRQGWCCSACSSCASGGARSSRALISDYGN